MRLMVCLAVTAAFLLSAMAADAQRGSVRGFNSPGGNGVFDNGSNGNGGPNGGGQSYGQNNAAPQPGSGNVNDVCNQPLPPSYCSHRNDPAPTPAPLRPY
jgi:opacity protein-like surface antigen